MKKLLCVIAIFLMLIFALASCNDNPVIDINADGYVVVNGVVTKILADKMDVISVDADGYIIVNGVKTGHKVNTQSESTCTHDERFENKIDATCRNSGSYDLVVFCTKCNLEFTRSHLTIAKLPHDISDWITDKTATCTIDGLRHKECKTCGEILETEVITGPGHNYSNNVCTECGHVLCYSRGLAYTSNGDGTCYVSGIGSCKDAHVTIPPVSPFGDRVTEIGERAFWGCSSMESVIIPKSVTRVGYCAFANYPNFKTIYCETSTKPDGWDQHWNSDGAATNSYYPVVWGYTGVTGVTIDGFQWASTKEGIGIVGYIGENADAVIPDKINGINVVTICDNAFNNLNNVNNRTDVTSVTLSDNITSIGFGAFHFSNLSYLVIGKNVDYIGEAVLYSWANADLVVVYYKGTEAEWNEIEIDNRYDHNNRLFRSPRYYYSVTQPSTEGNFWHYVDGVPTVWDGYDKPEVEPETSYYSVGLSYAYNSDGTCSVAGIGSCTDTDIVIPSVSPDGFNVTSINTYAFSNNSKITSVTLQEGITKIDLGAFSGCSSLVCVYIPKSVNDISFIAFNCCRSLEAIHVDSENEYYQSIDGDLYNKDATSLILHTPGKAQSTFIIPDSVTGMDAYSIAYSASLKTVIIGHGISSIGNFVFADCHNLENVVIPTEVSAINGWAFQGCSALSKVFYLGNESMWSSINISTGNDDLLNATRYFYSETHPTTTGNYWHYVNGVPTVWQ